MAELGCGQCGRGSGLMTAGPWKLVQGLWRSSGKVHERVGGRDINLGTEKRPSFRCGGWGDRWS